VRVYYFNHCAVPQLPLPALLLQLAVGTVHLGTVQGDAKSTSFSFALRTLET